MIAYKLIRIMRASEGTMSGKLTHLGYYRLPTREATLGTRQESMFGNGCPSPWITHQHKKVPVVDICGRAYVLTSQPNGKVGDRSCWEVHIHSHCVLPLNWQAIHICKECGSEVAE